MKATVNPPPILVSLTCTSVHLHGCAFVFCCRGQKTSVRFEEYKQWLPELQERILELGSRFRINSPIHGGQVVNHTASVNTGGRMCFPVLTLLEELEEITAELGQACARSEQGGDFDRRWVHS